MCAHLDALKKSKAVKIHVCLCIVQIMHSKKAKQSKSMCVCALCKLCTQRKQSSRNPCVFVHCANYALKESSELCTMLMSSNEHAQHQC
jgi:hypothetical protein